MGWLEEGTKQTILYHLLRFCKYLEKIHKVAPQQLLTNARIHLKQQEENLSVPSVENLMKLKFILHPIEHA